MAKYFHIDKEWINGKIAGHGGSYSYKSVNGIATITYIGGKNKLTIMWYNFVLLIRHIKRVIKGGKENEEH